MTSNSTRMIVLALVAVTLAVMAIAYLLVLRFYSFGGQLDTDQMSEAAADTRVRIELVSVDDAAPEPHIARILAEATRDPRIRVVRRASNGGISVASRIAPSPVAYASSPW